MPKPRFILLVVALLQLNFLYAQSFNEDKMVMVSYLKRMYNSSPFEGVKIVDNYDHQYLISVLSLDKSKYTSPSILNRVAQVKAQSQANTYLNGSTISSDLVIKATEQKEGDKTTTTVVESIELIKENSTGFTQGLELLTNFEDEHTKRMVFIYFREIQKSI